MANHNDQVNVTNDGGISAELAGGLVREAEHREAAARIARQLQNLSRTFEQSQYIDEMALVAGLQLRDELKRLREKGDPTLLYELEQLPEFKENRNVYQGQANLAEMAEVGKEAFRNLTDIREQELQQEQKERLLLDIMVGEAANAMKIHKELEEARHTLEKQQDSLQATEDFRDFFRGTEEVEALAQETQAELGVRFGSDFSSQRTFVDVFNAASEKESSRQIEKSKELEKQKEKEQEQHVLTTEDRKRKLVRDTAMSR